MPEEALDPQSILACLLGVGELLSVGVQHVIDLVLHKSLRLCVVQARGEVLRGYISLERLADLSQPNRRNARQTRVEAAVILEVLESPHFLFGGCSGSCLLRSGVLTALPRLSELLEFVVRLEYVDFGFRFQDVLLPRFDLLLLPPRESRRRFAR